MNNKSIVLENEVRRILDIAIDGFCLVNKSGIILDVNAAFCNMSCYSKNELLGLNVRKLTRKGSELRLFKKINEIKKLGAQNFESYLKRKDGKILNIDFSVNYLSKGKTGEIFVLIRDITKRKNLEKKILDQKVELSKKNIALQEILSQIEIEKKQIKDNILSSMEKLIIPTLLKLKKRGSKIEKKYIEFLETNLKNFTSAFASKISTQHHKLSPREIEICNMAKSGLSSKEIAHLLHASIRTVENHRQHIRKKFNIKNQNINLASYLQNF